MYNINFDVKYNLIENELLEKIKLGETDYSKEDIQIICEKLYNDEFNSVFFSENIFDDKIDDGIKYIMEEMIKNFEFVSLLNEIKGLLMFDQASDKNNTYDYNSNYIIILATLSYPVFHIMHNCIKQQLTNKNIDENLLVQLKEALIKYISNSYK